MDGEIKKTNYPLILLIITWAIALLAAAFYGGYWWHKTKVCKPTIPGGISQTAIPGSTPGGIQQSPGGNTQVQPGTGGTQATPGAGGTPTIQPSGSTKPGSNAQPSPTVVK